MSIVIGLVTESANSIVTTFVSDKQISTQQFGEEGEISKIFALSIGDSGTNVREKSTDVLFGFCGAPAFGHHLRYSVELPNPSFTHERLPHISDKMVDAYVYNQLIPYIASSENERLMRFGMEPTGSVFMIGILGRLYTVDSYFNSTRPKSAYAAIGNGEMLAIGAMDAYEQFEENRGYVYDPPTKLANVFSIVSRRTLAVGYEMSILWTEDLI